jgi:limonene-1,2-epoxide hydrolase
MQGEALAVGTVRAYWARMQSNDFRFAAQLLADDYVLDWPQSNERIRGRDNFIAINETYPAHGKWQFRINRIVGDDVEAVSDVSITDGVQLGRAITFSTVRDGLITRQTEFWPEDYPGHANRRHLVEAIS